MSCRDFILYGRCNRQMCNYLHYFLNCKREGANCRGSHCNRFHLSEEEIGDVRHNRRPWTQKIQQEVARVAYIIKRSYPPHQRKYVCTKILTGSRRCEDECDTCFSLDQGFSKYSNYMTCKVCYLPGINTCLMECKHVYHSTCLERLELNTEGALPSYKCAKCKELKGPNVPVFLDYLH